MDWYVNLAVFLPIALLAVGVALMVGALIGYRLGRGAELFVDGVKVGTVIRVEMPASDWANHQQNEHPSA